jgi:hypothetical protein
LVNNTTFEKGCAKPLRPLKPQTTNHKPQTTKNHKPQTTKNHKPLRTTNHSYTTHLFWEVSGLAQPFSKVVKGCQSCYLYNPHNKHIE